MKIRVEKYQEESGSTMGTVSQVKLHPWPEMEEEVARRLGQHPWWHLCRERDFMEAAPVR